MGRIRLYWIFAAREGLKGHRAYIAEDSPQNAKRFVGKLKAYACNLRYVPEHGVALEHLNDPEVREIYYGNYRIIDRFGDKQVTILRVKHGAQKLTSRELMD